MKTRFKTILILLLIPAVLLADNGKFSGKYTKEKTIKKEFKVNPDALLKVSNSFGNIDIVTWNENRTVIDVVIKTNGNDEEKVQQRLDDITVEFSASASSVSANTIFKNKKSSWNWWGKKNNVSIEVNYTIKIPVTNSVDLDNNYGAINLTTLEGHAKINCDYGQINVGELKSDDNALNFDYTNNSVIEYMKSGKINADYSGFTLEKVGRLDLNADYTNSEITEVGRLDFNCDYGKIVVGSANSMAGNGDYVNTKIGSVSSDVELKSDYGSIKIDNLMSSLKNARIDGSYTGIKIGFDAGLNFDYTFSLNYASLKGEELLTVKHSEKNGKDKKYSGFHGHENSGNNINIKSSFGGLTLIKN